MGIKVSRILHAGYVFESGGTRIAFDPIFENPFSRNCHAFPDVKFDLEELRRQKFDAVFISHYHDDHCSLASLDLLDRTTPIFMFCLFEDLFAMLRDLGFLNVHPLTLNQCVKIGAFDVLPRRALDEDVDSIFHIRAEDLNILNVVDSWIGPDTLNLLKRTPWDLILWPFQTLRELEILSPSRAPSAPPEIPHEWIEQLRALQPKHLVPSSCQFQMESGSWLNHALFPITYSRFTREIGEALPGTSIVRLNPGTSVILTADHLEKSTPLKGLEPIGDQDVDYDFDPHAPPQTTSEIARHFPALEPEQNRRVLDYCARGLLEKYRSLESPDGDFFRHPRRWQLSIFDHNGEEQILRYNVCGSEISLAATDDNAPIAWKTEIPLARLYGALFEGESLTSISIRINDMVFAPDIETALSEADLLEDPLLRCLYTGTFGAYQRMQLNRLKTDPPRR